MRCPNLPEYPRTSAHIDYFFVIIAKTETNSPQGSHEAPGTYRHLDGLDELSWVWSKPPAAPLIVEHSPSPSASQINIERLHNREECGLAAKWETICLDGLLSNLPRRLILMN